MFLLFEKDNLSVRYLQEKDKHLLVKWLSNAKVLEFYEGRDNPFDLEKVNQSFYHGDETVIKCMVEYQGVPIGYIQFYQVNSKTSTIDHDDADETVYGMDQFIGEPDYWSKGIGTLLVKSMVEYLMEQVEADRVIMDPQVTNNRALKCYEKCGFKRVKLLPKHEFHEGEYRDCWLIEYKKSI
ncbi:GNAT family N-acetyltransferase [Virgibacillus profundi]|uniref:GNAT family N-acetyltransferase n=1 Tax=Virgibacillus profundi TaxID=2024555 RepID=A0A2A2IA68_9BACI|nr:GNAT family N-acetyltransferase [Virgibacillus profundi]PAV27943.1 GNAT family N-acetyltransferase [Virgibacillus profundi]PXY52121.1 N-acetyltransferase [Virgibacillus profundi]